MQTNDRYKLALVNSTKEHTQETNAKRDRPGLV